MSNPFRPHVVYGTAVWVRYELVAAGDDHTASTFKICMGGVCRFLEFQKLKGSKPTFRIYVPSWLTTPVRKSRHQTHCNFLSNFEARDFSQLVFDPWLKNSGAGPTYKPFALAVTRSVSQHLMGNIHKMTVLTVLL